MPSVIKLSLGMDHSISRSRHHIFKKENDRPPTNPPVNVPVYSPPSTLTSSSPVESLLRDSLFSLESIRTVLVRLQQYDTSISQLTQQLSTNLQGFNKLAEVQFEESEVLKQIISYHILLDSYDETLTNYSVISMACPHDTQDISIKFHTNIQDIKSKLNAILLQTESLRNTLLQSFIKLSSNPEALTSSPIPEQSQQLRHFLRTTRTLRTEYMLILFSEYEVKHNENTEKLQRYKSICCQLESVFESMKLMEISQKEMGQLIESMSEHFIQLNSRLSHPEELLKTKREFKEGLEERQGWFVENKKRFEKNVSNSYLKGYTEMLEKYSLRLSEFEKGFQEYRVNGRVFDSIYQHKCKLEERMKKKGKTPQDIQQIRNIYRSLLDLKTNSQLNYYKQSLISQHTEAFKRLSIDIEPTERVENELLSLKIKQFQKVVEAGLTHMSINLEQLKIIQSQFQLLLQQRLPEEELSLCRNYIKQVEISVKLVSLFDSIKANGYRLVEESLYRVGYSTELTKKISNVLVNHLDNMCGYSMFSVLFDLFWEYMRDMIILNEIAAQYNVLKLRYKAKLETADENQLEEEHVIASQDIQLIFPIMKSIRSLSSTDPSLKLYLQKNVFRIYYDYIYNLIIQANSNLSPQQIVQTIRNNPWNFNSFQVLGSGEYFRRKNSFIVPQFLDLLGKTIQRISETWLELSLKQKVTQLIKLYFFEQLMEVNDLKSYREYESYRGLLEYLVGYLNLDTEIRVISGLEERITYQSPLFYELVKLHEGKRLVKCSQSRSDLIWSQAKRLVTQLEDNYLFKITEEGKVPYLIQLLQVVESDNDLREILRFGSISKVEKRALLYYYVQNILARREQEGLEEVGVAVQNRGRRYQVDIQGLEAEVGRVINQYGDWASDVLKRMKGEDIESRVYPFEFQGEILRNLK